MAALWVWDKVHPLTSVIVWLGKINQSSLLTHQLPRRTAEMLLFISVKNLLLLIYVLFIYLLLRIPVSWLFIKVACYFMVQQLWSYLRPSRHPQWLTSLYFDWDTPFQSTDCTKDYWSIPMHYTTLWLMCWHNSWFNCINQPIVTCCNSRDCWYYHQVNLCEQAPHRLLVKHLPQRDTIMSSLLSSPAPTWSLTIHYGLDVLILIQLIASCVRQIWSFKELIDVLQKTPMWINWKCHV